MNASDLYVVVWALSALGLGLGVMWFTRRASL